MPPSLEVGAPAPRFSLPDADGSTIALDDFAGTFVVLVFYPKDDTSGCTTAALDFSALAAAFTEAGAVVIGISPDSPESHDRFRGKHGLTIRLASDEPKTALGAYGVWVEKSMYGRKYMGVERTTVLVAPDGRIARVWPKVKIPGHAAEVLATVETLAATAP